MNPDDLKTKAWYLLPDHFDKNKFARLRYTGTARDVKDLLHWFFNNEKDQCVFLNLSEVQSLKAE
jgi:hypothetical protein